MVIKRNKKKTVKSSKMKILVAQPVFAGLTSEMCRAT